MPATATKSGGVIRGAAKSTEVPYIIRGATTVTDALVSLLTTADPIVDGKYLSTTESGVEEMDPGSGVWSGSAKYISTDSGNLTAMQEDTFRLTFDISGTTQKITQSLRTVSSYAIAGTFKKNYGGLIGVNGDTVEGCDILVATTSYEFSAVYPANLFDDGTFIRTLILAVGSVNGDVFQGLQVGEGLLNKVSGQRRADRKWVLRFGVAVNVNRAITGTPADDLYIGNSGDSNRIGPIAKAGWDYLWCEYQLSQQDNGTGTKFTARTPRVAYVEEVYRRTLYANLNISTTEA